MNEYVKVTPDSGDGNYIRANLAIHLDSFEAAQQYIDKSRLLLDAELKVMTGESYNRAYRILVKCQQLSEMEEVIDYKNSGGEVLAERRTVIKEMWTKRLHGMQRQASFLFLLIVSYFSCFMYRNQYVWQDVLVVRSLVLDPLEDVKNWLKFAILCRKKRQIDWARGTVLMLLGGTDPFASASLYSSRSPPLPLNSTSHIAPPVCMHGLNIDS
jgi:FKBP12-rapamycin complex-associated protein